MKMKPKIFNPAENKVGGFTENDGTIDFYARVNSLINKDLVVLDYGAGRGGWENDKCKFRKDIRDLRGKAKKLYASDIDEAVLLNKNVDQSLLMKGNKVDVKDNFFDIVIADYVLEHIKILTNLLKKLIGYLNQEEGFVLEHRISFL